MSEGYPKKLIVLVIVWTVIATYATTWIDHGWIPHDEGTLAQSAERVLSGELPHRDFDEAYTGGLSYLNALAFQLRGVNLLSLRIVLLVFFLAWVPALYYVALHFVRPVAAGAVVLLAVAWSVPNYAAPMPSWYNLFFAVFGTAALLRYLDDDKRRWLFVAGLFAGLSCLAKIVGLYFVAAVLLFLAFREQFLLRATRQPAEHNETRARPGAYTQFAFAFLLLFLALLVYLVAGRLGTQELIHFVLPAAALAVLFVWNERTGPTGPSRERFATLTRLVAPFALGLSLPLAIFLLPYVISGSLDALYNGLFVKTMKQLTSAHVRPPSLRATTVAATPLVLFLASSYWRSRVGRVQATLVALLLGGVLVSAGTQDFVYRLVWYSARMLVPVTAVAGVAMLMQPNPRTPISALRRQQVLVLLCAMVMVSVVQFPFSAPIYFCYIAPILVLTVCAVISSIGVSNFAPAATLCFYLLFAVFWVNQTSIYAMGFFFDPGGSTRVLSPDRGGLRVGAEEQDEYERLVAELRAHASSGYMYATPDCPEVYFLSGLRNPTRTFFDFFDEPVGRTARILDALEENQVQVVALNRTPYFSGAVPPDLAAALAERYPRTVEIGRFEVRWRDSSRVVPDNGEAPGSAGAPR